MAQPPSERPPRPGPSADPGDERASSTVLDTVLSDDTDAREGLVSAENSAVETLRPEENRLDDELYQVLERFLAIYRARRAPRLSIPPEARIIIRRRPQLNVSEMSDRQRRRYVLNVLRRHEERVRRFARSRSPTTSDGGGSMYTSLSESNDSEGESSNILVLWRSRRGRPMLCYVCASVELEPNTRGAPHLEFDLRVCLSLPRPGGTWEMECVHLNPRNLGRVSHRLSSVRDNFCRVLWLQ